MKHLFAAALLATACLITHTGALAQSNAQLSCRGAMGDVPGILSGVRQILPYNALGDGYV